MRRVVAPIALLASLLLAGRGAGGGPAEGPSAEDRVIVATVGGEPIYAGRVARMLRKATAGREVNPKVLPRLRARLLAELVDRRLVLAYARRTDSGADPSKVDEAVAALQAKLAAEGGSPVRFLEERSSTEAELRRQIHWELTWQKYLARYITEKRLAAYFQAHRREFDGTQISVSHILLRAPAGAGPGATADLVRRAGEIRQEILAGRVSFQEAAREHSAGPSGNRGGRLGWISRDGPMVEAFSRAAFKLQPGQLSRPLVTPFGVHLIRCDEVRPGRKQMDDVRPQLREALARELLAKLARLERRHTSVRYTGAAPYLKPETGELVPP